jgi:hypothetical protein
MPLSKEIIHRRLYLFAPKRFEDTLFFRIHRGGNCWRTKSAFACFIHFVENIFKHGMINNAAFPAKNTNYRA